MFVPFSCCVVEYCQLSQSSLFYFIFCSNKSFYCNNTINFHSIFLHHFVFPDAIGDDMDDDDLSDIAFDSDGEDTNDRNNKNKKFKKKKSGDEGSLFASAEEFASLLEDEGQSNIAPGGSNVVSNKDNASKYYCPLF